MDQTQGRSLLVIAAESSAAQYASDLIAKFDERNLTDLHLFGVGDQKMVDQGFEALARAEEMAVVGVQEVLANYSKIKSAFFRVLEAVDKYQPKVAVLIDYPGFNLKLAKELHERKIKVLYYVSPQLWAWKKGRIEIVKKYVDHMMVLFPFEEKFYQEHKVPVTCVGHPMKEDVAPELFDPENRSLQRRRYGILEEDQLIGFMPGSRNKEIQMHLPTQIQVARELYRKDSSLKLAFLVAPTLEKQQLLPFFEDVRFPYILIKADPVNMIALTDRILAASGTATLQVALMKRPMVVMYKMNWLTSWVARLLVSAKHFALVNVILDREAVPERFQEKANVKELVRLVEELAQPEVADQQLQAFEELSAKLPGGATDRVAQIVLEHLESC